MNSLWPAQIGNYVLGVGDWYEYRENGIPAVQGHVVGAMYKLLLPVPALAHCPDYMVWKISLSACKDNYTCNPQVN